MTVTADAVSTSTAHHDRLHSSLSERVDAVLQAVRQGAPEQDVVRELDPPRHAGVARAVLLPALQERFGAYQAVVRSR